LWRSVADCCTSLLGATFAPVFAELARDIATAVQPRRDRFVVSRGRGFRIVLFIVGHLPDSNLVARRFASMRFQASSSPALSFRDIGFRKTPESFCFNEALLQGTVDLH